jgi:hypothetical protein
VNLERKQTDQDTPVPTVSPLGEAGMHKHDISRPAHKKDQQVRLTQVGEAANDIQHDTHYLCWMLTSICIPLVCNHCVNTQ